MTRSTVSTCPPGAPSSDERAAPEFEAYLQAQDPVDVAATLWHTRREQGLDDAEAVEFQQWLSANPAHKTAFDHLDDSLHLLRSLPPERVAHLRRAAGIGAEARPVAGKPVAAHPRNPDRRGLNSLWPSGLTVSALGARAAAVALCCAAVLGVGVAWDQWRKQPVFAGHYIAQRGERLDVPLPDGSELSLDAGTRVEIALYRDRREARLEEGQAMFSVARDPARPFEVLAGSARVTVVGTRFSVRYVTWGSSAGEVDVEVEEGHVRLANATPGSPGSANSLVDLLAGQAIHLSPSGTPGGLTPVAPGSIAPWRKGLIRFTSTPLSEALQEMERYGPINLVIRDPDVAAMPIGGSYQIGNPDAFVRVLPQILPVRLVRRDDGRTEIAKLN